MKIGDTVRLNSGGSLMTIIKTEEHAVEGGPLHECSWHITGAMQDSRSIFPEAALTKIACPLTS